MSLLVVGSIAYDTIETPTTKVEDSLGGSALYFSAAASLFTPVNVVGVVGSDFDASKISFLKKRGVNLDGLYMESGKTFRWGGRYFEDMNRRETLFTYLNVFERFQPVIPENYKKSQFVFLANIDPELQLEVLKQITDPRLIVLDTMNFWISGKHKELEKVLKYADIIVLNDEEAKELTGEMSLIKATRAIPKMGPKSVIVKKGEHGAMLFHENEFFFVPAFPLENVVDPTGAGDSFAGGFMGYLAKNGQIDLATLKKAIVFGSTIASFNVEDFSFKRLETLTMKEIKQRVKIFKRMTAF